MTAITPSSSFERLSADLERADAYLRKNKYLSKKSLCEIVDVKEAQRTSNKLGNARVTFASSVVADAQYFLSQYVVFLYAPELSDFGARKRRFIEYYSKDEKIDVADSVIAIKNAAAYCATKNVFQKPFFEIDSDSEIRSGMFLLTQTAKTSREALPTSNCLAVLGEYMEYLAARVKREAIRTALSASKSEPAPPAAIAEPSADATPADSEPPADAPPAAIAEPPADAPPAANANANAETDEDSWFAIERSPAAESRRAEFLKRLKELMPELGAERIRYISNTVDQYVKRVTSKSLFETSKSEDMKVLTKTITDHLKEEGWNTPPELSETFLENYERFLIEPNWTDAFARRLRFIGWYARRQKKTVEQVRSSLKMAEAELEKEKCLPRPLFEITSSPELRAARRLFGAKIAGIARGKKKNGSTKEKIIMDLLNKYATFVNTPQGKRASRLVPLQEKPSEPSRPENPKFADLLTVIEDRE